MPVTHVGVNVPDATPYAVKAQNSGLTHWMPDLTSDTTITLPTPKAGLKFRFAYNGAAADAQDWLIDSGSNTYFFKGGLMQFVTAGGAGSDEIAPFRSDGNSNSKITVLTPDVGTWIEVDCVDGTTWNVSGHVLSNTATAIVFADQA